MAGSYRQKHRAVAGIKTVNAHPKVSDAISLITCSLILQNWPMANFISVFQGKFDVEVWLKKKKVISRNITTGNETHFFRRTSDGMFEWL